MPACAASANLRSRSSLSRAACSAARWRVMSWIITTAAVVAPAAPYCGSRFTSITRRLPSADCSVRSEVTLSPRRVRSMCGSISR